MVCRLLPCRFGRMIAKPEQRLQKVVLAVDKRPVLGTSAGAMAEDPRGRGVAGSDGRQIVINQRMQDSFRAGAELSLVRRVGHGAQAQQPGGENGRRRGVAIAEVYAFVVQVVP